MLQSVEEPEGLTFTSDMSALRFKVEMRCKIGGYRNRMGNQVLGGTDATRWLVGVSLPS